jgi:DNA (cytosine-5)-methyltransferase 1
LCCGAGGLAYGFQVAGFDVALGVDIDKEALLTYKKNLPDAVVLQHDIRDLNRDSILNSLPANKQKIEGVLAAPPCRGFSQSNRRSRSLDNPLNLLYLDVIRVISEVHPNWFLIENVWGLKQVAQGYVLTHILELSKALGYATVAKVLNASDYGVAQIRKRIFFVGILGDLKFRFPTRTSSRHVTVREAIGDLPFLNNGDNRNMLPYRVWGAALSQYQGLMRSTRTNGPVSGNSTTKNNKTVITRYKYIPPGGNWENIPCRLMKNYADRTKCHTGIYRRLQWDAPSIVISNFRKNMLIHPEQNRGLSVREAARLQSFPDSFIFEGRLGSQQQQVADAVPPLLARALAKAIKRTFH